MINCQTSAPPLPEPPLQRLRLGTADAVDIPVLWEGDVFVAGGGSAGCAAAVAAARHGASVLLAEDAGFFGGTAVAVLDTMYGFFPPGGDERVVGGIAWEIASELLADSQAMLRPNSYGAGTGVTYEPEALKVVWDRKLRDVGVLPLLHSRVVAAIVEGGRVVGVVLQTRRGPYRVLAKRFVDATGDADLAWMAGCVLEQPSDGRRVQPLTTTFRVGGVGKPPPGDELRRLICEAAESGMYDLPRREGSVHRTMLPGVFHTNMTRVSGVDPTDPWALSRAEEEGRIQTQEYVRFLRERVPGFEKSYLLSTSVRIGARETRRLVGAYVLDREDVLSARRFDDTIALCGAPIEDHDSGDRTIWKYVASDSGTGPTGRVYGVPFRSLVPAEVDGLLVAGRCLSATHDAHASARSIAQCLSYGHAAGTASALSLSSAVELRDLDAAELRRTLAAEEVIV